METNEKKRQIKQKRADYKRKRKKKFRYLRNTSQYDNYYESKHKEKVNVIKKISKVIKLKWYQKFYRFIKKLLKRCITNYKEKNQ